MKGWDASSVAKLGVQAVERAPVKMALHPHESEIAEARRELEKQPCADLVLCWRPKGSFGRWRKTSHQAPEPFADQILASARNGTMVGLTAPITIPAQLDPAVCEFSLQPAGR